MLEWYRPGFDAAALLAEVAELVGEVIGARPTRRDAWGALFLRYRGFPWDDYVRTSVAVSTGLNWATGISEVERDRASDGEGGTSQIMHYLAPEITFALPSRPNTELMLRFHHRSGIFGLINDAWGGAQYATVGIRMHF